MFSGLHVTWDSRLTGRDRLKHVTIMTGLHPSEVEEDKPYLVLTNEYLAKGGDGFKHFASDGQPLDGAELPMCQLISLYLREL